MIRSDFSPEHAAILERLGVTPLQKVGVSQYGYPTISRPGHTKLLVHRLVAAELMGAKLDRKTVVHHEDGARMNFLPSNLRVMQLGQHTAEHNAERIWRAESLQKKRLAMTGRRDPPALRAWKAANLQRIRSLATAARWGLGA